MPDSSAIGRRAVLQASACWTVGLTVGATAACSSETPKKPAHGGSAVDLASISLPAPSGAAKTALGKLVSGNARFVAGAASHPHQSRQRVSAVAAKQAPFAVILSCSDSRVPPEVLFDAGIGDLFVIRVAGNIVADPLLGSVEYAIEHLGSSLVVVLGHENCGAVKAAIESHQTGEGPSNHVKSIVSAVLPVVEAVDAAKHGKKSASADTHEGGGGDGGDADLIDTVVTANARWTAHQIAEKAVLSAAAGDFAVVAARYDLDSAKVTWLNH